MALTGTWRAMTIGKKHEVRRLGNCYTLSSAYDVAAHYAVI